jgi:MEDS: MEthanogen/methylotroph, DcmR Sensory domain
VYAERRFSLATLAPIHSVHFYDTHQALIDRLRGIVTTGLDSGNAVLIVATENHRTQLVDALEQNGIDVGAAIRDERFIMSDASDMLSMFMVGGFPDLALFLSSVGKLLVSAKKSALSKDQGLVVFGEMVAVLWDQGNQDGALALERLWNVLLNERAFHMHCAYPRALFAQDETGMANICEGHSHVVGALAQPS